MQPIKLADDSIAHAVRSISKPANVAGYARILAAANSCGPSVNGTWLMCALSIRRVSPE
jgi:hypothetical protein